MFDIENVDHIRLVLCTTYVLIYVLTIGPRYRYDKLSLLSLFYNSENEFYRNNLVKNATPPSDANIVLRLMRIDASDSDAGVTR